jgi:hypothetical protein
LLAVFAVGEEEFLFAQELFEGGEELLAEDDAQGFDVEEEVRLTNNVVSEG